MKIPFSIPARPDSGEALNLRASSDTLTESTGVTRLLSDDGWKPAGGNFLAKGHILGVLDGDTVTEVGTCGAEIKGVRPVSPDSALVITAAGFRRAALRDGRWEVSEGSEEIPAVSLRTGPDIELTAAIASRTLGADYSRAYRLEPADLKLIASDMRDAYSRIGANADALGLFIQPVLARWKITDAEGITLFISPPLLLSASDGYQGCRQMDVDGKVSDKGVTVLDGYTLSINAFSIKADIPDEIAQKGWKCTVEVSPQIDPVDFGRDPVYNLNPRDTTGPLLRLMLPGAGTVAKTGEASVWAVADRWDSVAREYHAGEGEGGDASKRRRALDALASSAIADADVDPAMLPPHSFTCKGWCDSGNVVIWHGMKPVRFSGYSPDRYAVSDCQTESRAVMTVDFDDGARCVAYARYSATSPEKLSPFVSYPDPRAVKATLLMQRGGETREYVMKLSASPGRRMAAFIHPSGLPFNPWDEGTATGEFYVPVAVEGNLKSDDGLCACATVDRPLQLTHSARISAGDVTGVAPAPSSGSAWDFAAPKFTVFCTDGIHAVALAASPVLRIKGSRLLDRRSVRSAAAICASSSGVYAIAGGDLVKVGRTSVETIEAGVGPEGVTACVADRLWLARPGMLHEITPRGRRMEWTSRSALRDTAPVIDRMIPGSDGRLLASDTSGKLYDLATSADSITPLRWSGVVEVHGQLNAVVLDMRCRLCTLRLKVTVEDAQDAPPLLDASIKGCVAAPIRFPVLSPPVCRLRIELEGNAAARAALYPLTLQTSKRK